MTNRVLLDKTEEKLGLPGLCDALAKLQTSELTALLMETARKRAERRNPSELLRAWASDAYVTPVATDIRALKQIELDMLNTASLFEAVELSPVAPLGTCSTFSSGGQNRVLSAARNLEVLADPTNALVLECAARRRQGQKQDLRLCTIARLVRCQPLKAAHHTRHFSLFAAVTAGRARDSRVFAEAHLREHITLHRALHQAALGEHPGAPATRLVLYATEPYQAVAEALVAHFSNEIPEGRVESLDNPYYSGLRFQVWIRIGDEEFPISDGGRFDWMQTLCSDRKEQLVTSALGTEIAGRKTASKP